MGVLFFSRYSRLFADDLKVTEIYAVDPSLPIPSEMASSLLVQFDPSKFMLNTNQVGVEIFVAFFFELF